MTRISTLALVAVITLLASCRDAEKAQAEPGGTERSASALAPDAGAAGAGAGAGAVAVAGAVGAALPPDPARVLVLGRCIICHDDMYFGQQRLSSEQWQKTVAKMRMFGAPVSEDESNVIAAYLSATFPPDVAEPAPRLVSKSTIATP